MRFRTSLRALCVLLLASISSMAQWRVYDKQKDAIAQDALREAQGIQSGAVFEKQVRNLRALSERDVAVMLEAARIRMRGYINGFRTWDDVEFSVQRARDASKVEAPPDIAQVRADLEVQRTQLVAEIATLKAVPTEDDSLKEMMNTVGDVEPAIAFGQKLLDEKHAAGLATVGAVLKDLKSLYADYSAQLAAVDRVVSQINSLKIQVKKALLLRLKVEEDFLLSRAALYERREKELEPIRALIARFRRPEGVDSADAVHSTINALSRDRSKLQLALRSLYTAASLAARAELPDDLYKLRMAQLEHLKSIQISAANARVYESVLGGGVRRLALYYQGGVRPETLAQIVQSLSTVGIFGKLLTQ